MKQILFLPLLFFMFSCEKEETELTFSTGINGTVEYGIGDCMPIYDREESDYDDYNGTLYFIVKSEIEALGEGSFEELKENSLSTIVKKGHLAAKLPPETYLVMPENVYEYSDENTVRITQGVVLKKDFYFWKCTSY